MSALYRLRHVWIALGLLIFNGLAWLAAAPVLALPEVAPRLDPQIAEFREKLWGGKSAGERFALTITDRTASEAVAWFLEKHPEVPFSRPQVEFTPEEITARGIAGLFGMRVLVYGRVGVELRGGLPAIEIRELGMAGSQAPAFLTEAITNELGKQIDVVKRMPMAISRLELQQGQIVIEGVFRAP
jgi:hypothetical protein